MVTASGLGRFNLRSSVLFLIERGGSAKGDPAFFVLGEGRRRGARKASDHRLGQIWGVIVFSCMVKEIISKKSLHLNFYTTIEVTKVNAFSKLSFLPLSFTKTIKNIFLQQAKRINIFMER